MTTHHLSPAPADLHLHRVRRDHEQALVDQILAATATAACRGWTPDDLRHVLGNGVAHLLFLAHHRVTAAAATTESVRRAWRRQCHAVDPLPWAVTELENWLTTLRELPLLADEEILTDLHQLHEREEDPDGPDGLDGQQRRAAHRIAGLLRKAESTTFDAEAETLVAKAQQLRQRHRIDTALTPPGSPATSVELLALRVRMSAPWIRHQFLLLAQIAGANSCTAVLLSAHGIATVIGEAGDVRHTVDLFASLNRQCAHFMRISAGAHEASRTGQTTAYRRAFLLAYASRIGALLREAGADAAEDREDSDRALPVLAERSAAAEERTRQLFPALRGISFSSRHARGHRDGRVAAGRSHLRGDRAGLDRRSA
ncbi:DUF2786 domain-containing protein [Corynebacterium halotolerans]|uniref:DUF2786 domain-containing protein n=1 Tax=Corynebacterium halotolerans YIM 70093 = DSM 44683 TaxID=1121362 RepID=M1NNT8_9CORY|nr:DUF2786 domain-containing protein [Corynebacterium halotolerans]AGF72988.1 hypothetical protein A605_09930 [Corynebacterium halotolerans YIM 70093 = DSM 44683]